MDFGDGYHFSQCLPKYPSGFKFWDSEGTILDADVSGNTDTPSSLCEFASVSCFVKYTQEVGFVTDFRSTPSDECVALCQEVEDLSDDECYDACTPVCLEDSYGAFLDGGDKDVHIIEDWAESYQNLCVSVGDCGIKSNYIGKEGYSSWRDLFRGENINWDTLPNSEKRK